MRFYPNICMAKLGKTKGYAKLGEPASRFEFRTFQIRNRGVKLSRGKVTKQVTLIIRD